MAFVVGTAECTGRQRRKTEASFSGNKKTLRAVHRAERFYFVAEAV